MAQVDENDEAENIEYYCGHRRKKKWIDERRIMSIQDLKITAGDYGGHDVLSAPNRLTGTASENKSIFDRLIKELIAGRYNLLVDLLSGERGAANVGVTAISGVAGLTAQAMMAGLKALIDERYTIAQADGKLDLKFDKTQAQALVKTVDVDLQTGTLSVTKYDGTVQKWDTAIEKIALDVQLVGDEFVLTLADGTTQSVNLAKFIDHHNFADGDTVSFRVNGVDNNKTITAEVRDGTIKLAKFAPEVMAKFIEYAGKAEASAQASAASAANSEASNKSAGTFAANAKVSESAAKASETAARNSEGAAKGSEDAALASKNAAGVSANLADLRAKAAQASETAAGIAKVGAEIAAGRAADDAADGVSQELSGFVADGLREANRAKSEADRAKIEADKASEIVGGDFALRSDVAAAKAEAKLAANAAELAAKNASDTKGSAAAVRTELLPMVNLKAPIASPSFTGAPTAPTAALGSTNTAQLATLGFVNNAVAAFVNGAPGALDTLNELAAALGDDPNFATTITNLIATKAARAVPATLGNLAKLDGNGNVVDSGKSAASFETSGSVTAHNSASNPHAGVLAKRSEVFSKTETLTAATATKLGLNPTTATPDEAFGAIGKIVYEISSKGMARKALEPLSIGRFDFAAATNKNGCVLFGGGYSNTATVEKYDLTDRRTVIAPLTVARNGLSAATNGNGEVLFGGGYANDFSAVVEKYDSTDTRTTLTPLSAARTFMAAATNKDGCVLLGGGRANSHMGTVDRYDAANTRTIMTPLSIARSWLAAATNGNGEVLFGGGETSSSKSNAVDKYDVLGRRVQLAPLSDSVSGLAAATDKNGSVLFCTGTKVDRYDIADVKTTLTPIPSALLTLSAATNGNGEVLFGGGDSLEVYRYDAFGIRTVLPRLSSKQRRGVAATNGNGEVIFGGGIDASTAVDKYYPASISISLPLGTKYKFKEDSTEKMHLDLTGAPLEIPTPNTGYVRFGGTVTI